MFKRKRRLRRSNQRDGATTIEMALVAPFIFLMVFGSVEFARMMMVRQALTNAARQGCRKACLATTQSSVVAEDAARKAMLSVITQALTNQDLEVTFTPSFSSTPPESGTSITAELAIDCSDVSWLPPFFTADTRIKCSAVMNRE